MTDWKIAAATKSYRNSLKATESIDNPAIGFLKPETGAGLASVIKQNNTIIQLLVSISERLEDIQADFAHIKKDKGTSKSTPESLDPILEEIQRKLEGLHIGNPKPKAKSPFFVFKDPLQIYKSERSK